MRVLVTGAGGQLGSEVVAELSRRSEAWVRSSLDVVGASHQQLDVADRDQVMGAVRTLEPDVIVHCAAFTAVDRCESESDLAFAVNALGTRHLAAAARAVGAHLAYVSTDYVFDGEKPAPYDEWDLPNPLSVYGRSKLGGEQALSPESTIVRTSWVCGAVGSNMVKTVLRLLEAGQRPLRFVNDQHGCPTLAADLARMLVDLAIERLPGTFHVTNQGPTTWYGFVRGIVELTGGDVSAVEPISTDELQPPRPARRPRNSVLDNAALRLSSIGLLPPWQESTARLLEELRG